MSIINNLFYPHYHYLFTFFREMIVNATLVMHKIQKAGLFFVCVSVCLTLLYSWLVRFGAQNSRRYLKNGQIWSLVISKQFAYLTDWERADTKHGCRIFKKEKKAMGKAGSFSHSNRLFPYIFYENCNFNVFDKKYDGGSNLPQNSSNLTVLVT